MVKHGQAAMEFLMTYGWAMLALIIIIGVISYFMGLYTHLIPAQCTMGTPFSCVEYQVTKDGTVKLGIFNNGNQDMFLNVVTVYCEGGVVPTSIPLSPPFKTFIVAQGRLNGSMLVTNCGPIAGSQYQANIAIIYTYSGDVFSHTSTGYLRAYVE